MKKIENSKMKYLLFYNSKSKIYSIKKYQSTFSRSKKCAQFSVLNNVNQLSFYSAICSMMNQNLPRVLLEKLNFFQFKRDSTNFQGYNDSAITQSEKMDDGIQHLSQKSTTILNNKCSKTCTVQLTKLDLPVTKTLDPTPTLENDDMLSLHEINKKNINVKNFSEIQLYEKDNANTRNLFTDDSNSGSLILPTPRSPFRENNSVVGLAKKDSSSVEKINRCTDSVHNMVKLTASEETYFNTNSNILDKAQNENKIDISNVMKAISNDHNYLDCDSTSEKNDQETISKDDQFAISTKEVALQEISTEKVTPEESISDKSITFEEVIPEMVTTQEAISDKSITFEEVIPEMVITQEAMHDKSIDFEEDIPKMVTPEESFSDKTITFEEVISEKIAPENVTPTDVIDNITPSTNADKSLLLEKMTYDAMPTVSSPQNIPCVIEVFTSTSNQEKDDGALLDSVIHNSDEAEISLTQQSNQENYQIIFDDLCDVMAPNDDSPLKFELTREDKLIELAIMDLNPDTTEGLDSGDDDLSSYQVPYEISDQLNNILSFQLEGQAVDFVRDSIDTHESMSLSSLPEITPIDLKRLNSSSASNPPIININYTASSSSTTSDTFYDVNDPSFDPNEVRHSSTALDETINNRSGETTDNLAPGFADVEMVELDESEHQNKESDDDELENLNEAPLNYINSQSELRKIPLSRVGSIDNTELKVQKNIDAPRWRKKYHCMICHKLVVKLPRHLETVHKGHEEVKKLKETASGTRERKKVISIFRNNGNQMYNTNANYNKEKELLVPRRPKNEKPATAYTTCPNCLLTLAISNSRKHISKCCKESNLIKGSRTYKVLGSIVEGRLHSTACDKLRLVIFPVLKEDEIVRIIRYDWLMILWGNKLCIKHGPHFQHNLIRAKLRVVGRFIAAAKHENEDITDLSAVYTPKNINTVIKAIDIVARIDRMNNTCEAPAVALNLVTYLKQIGIILESEYVKREDEEKQKQVMNFIKVYLTEMPDAVNKIGMESQAKIKRQKVVVLPMTDDIQKMLTYLKSERSKCFAALEKTFNLNQWLNGLKLVAVYLLVFNRRRVGDIQNILVSDLNKLEKIDQFKDKEEFNCLDEAGKKIAQKFYRFQIRGKVNRTVAVIASSDLIKELKLLISYRPLAHIPANNEFLFGLPNPITDRIRVLNLCKEMRTISELCGAKDPHLLRGTGLRKHIATKCLELDLKASQLGDVIGHLGHSEQIHKNIYQQKLKSKTIVQVTKVLEAAQGDVEDFDSGDEQDERSEFIEVSNEENNISSTQENNSMHAEPGPSTSTADQNFDCSLNNLHPYENRSIKTSENFARNRLWSKIEKEVVLTEFKSYFEERKLPTLMEIDKLKARFPCLDNRRRDVIKTWISNQFKQESKAAGQPKIPSIKIKNPQAKKVKIRSAMNFNFDMKKFKRANYSDDNINEDF